MKWTNISAYREQLVLKPVFLLLVFFIFILVSNLVTEENVLSGSASKININGAMDLLKEKINEIYQKESSNIIRKSPYKISICKKLFEREAKIRQACSSEDLFTCKNESYLFFVDEAPWAQYKHSVRIGIIDSITKDIQIKQAGWWPVVNGTSYFLDNTPEKYITWPYNINMIPPPILQGQYKSTCNCDSNNLREDANYQNIIGNSVSNSKLWAIIIMGAIVGRDGINNQLAYDADGMYSILDAYDVPDSQIYYFKKKVKDVTPLTNDDRIYSTCLDTHSITSAFDEIQSKIKPADKFLFFISTHGENWKLTLCNDSYQCPNIDYYQMQTWLSRIRCKRLFVIINACESGSFVIGSEMSQCRYYDRDLSIPEGENNNRVVITSSSYDEPTPADIDNCDLNTDDRGSEFIGGFFEAFTKTEADIDKNNMISIGEAFDYAKKYAACGGGSVTEGPFTPLYTPVIKCSFSRGKNINPYKEFLFGD